FGIQSAEDVTGEHEPINLLLSIGPLTLRLEERRKFLKPSTPQMHRGNALTIGPDSEGKPRVRSRLKLLKVRFKNHTYRHPPIASNQHTSHSFSEHQADNFIPLARSSMDNFFI